MEDVGGLDHLAELVRVQDAFLASIDEVDPDTRVPWCGRWRVRDVVVHLGRIHHWAAAQARRTREVPLGRGPFDLAPFYAEHAHELRTALVELGPDAIGSTLLGPGPASFWRRRQLHETLVHLWDVRTAGGLPTSAPAPVWADTVDEVVTVMQPRQVRMGRMPPLEVTVRLVADDADLTWDMAGETGRSPDVTVTSSAERLALMLWKRVPTGDGSLVVAGDAHVLAQVIGQRITP
ncbi:maleylpyruvate isomerase family mycothiol-dependent enzyme [Cellulomonas sp. APG4]|uniref:maleylpyruvate isomerase family mycothiol-dependent enzyme n=1 Tax=Cellulomonas sp. APG4 TaxID=1538656 RepID=UPI00137B9379|nr:maleylpyruvate isomerase family mycothiol-dependent enzyme [Cellulomonas sp. APG4]NCT91536.1 maleylpyruvate isomerase family mycothiol-dependent enzyme [Cellulomonas sp. APG4]